MAQAAEVTFSNDASASLQPQAVVDGPLYVEIFRLKTVQPVGTFITDNVIALNEKFDIIMRVRFRDVLSELKVNFVADINVLNLKTGARSAKYSFTETGTLPGGGVTQMTLRKTLEASEDGIFLLSGSIGFPESKLFDFSLGGLAGTEPPSPAPYRLRIANFYVFDRKG